jgi:hypothetical protein
MRKRNWSDLVVAIMIAVCVTAVAEPGKARADQARSILEVPAVNVADAAESLAVAVLLSDESQATSVAAAADAPHSIDDGPSIADRAITDAAEAAGHVASDLEMPFFSFGGSASAE